MDTQVFLIVVNAFNHGNIAFHLGNNWSFLFNNNWYPVHAFMNDYNNRIGIQQEFNLHRSVFELSKFMPITTANINFQNHYPVPLI